MLYKALSALFGLQVVLCPTITDIPPIIQYKPACVSVECQIREISRQFNFPEETAVRIAKCESSLNPLARNPSSSAGGIWQFTDGTFLDGIKWRGLDWKLEDKFNVIKSTDMTIWFVRREGWGRWSCK